MVPAPAKKRKSEKSDRQSATEATAKVAPFEQEKGSRANIIHTAYSLLR